MRKLSLLMLLFFPVISYASFIETTIGTAVVNDATASYFNPAALVLLKNPQIIPLGSSAYLHSRFAGQSTPAGPGTTETGSASTTTRYFSPSIYFGLPATETVTVGLAIVTDSANRSVDDSSILRYDQASNNIQDFDLVPAISVKINDYFALGGGVNFSYADFHLQPITRLTGSNITDSQSDNQCDGTGVGGNAGFLLKPNPATVIGFNYRSLTTYHLSGTSSFEGPRPVFSNKYHFKLWTPARSVLSINYFLTPRVGLMTTIQRIQWSVIRNIHVNGIATLSGSTPAIVNGSIPYYLHNAWLLTLGSQYRVTPRWIIRAAGTYNQSPGNKYYQVVTGDSLILGVSTGYDVSKFVTIDGSFAHAFIRNQGIHIANARNVINGVNTAARDAVSLKLTFNA